MFKTFGEAAEYVYSKEELKFFLDKTLATKESFIKWKNRYKEKRIEFVKEYFSVLEKESEEIIVDTIIKKLNAK